MNKQAIWRSVNSEHGDRLVEIAIEHVRFVKELIWLPRGTDGEIIASRITALRKERDGILELYEGEEADTHE